MIDLNGGFMYAIVAIVVAFVVAESVFFLMRALRRAKKLGIQKKTLKNIIISSAVFTVAPAVAILLGVITLSASLGLPFPWLRLSVIGALTYELPAAETAAAALGASLNQPVTDPKVFSSIAWVMTLGIIPPLILVPIFGKNITGAIDKMKMKDQRWSEIFMASLFLGMISAFLGRIFSDVRSGMSGWIPVFVMLMSAVLMALCGLFQKLTKAKWITDYALPVSMLGGMALAIPITNAVSSVAGV